MTGRALYERHSRALYDTRAWRYVGDIGAFRTFDDRPAPKMWHWLSNDERNYWNVFARAISSHKAKRS